jgi:hypothetical protein
VLEVIDPRSGIVTRSMHLAGAYQIPPATLSGVPGGISQNGAWLVLQAFDSTGTTVTGSHMLVVDTSLALKPTPINLPGDFTFDAVSNDGLSVYMIQHVGSAEYYVRLYHVDSSTLDPAIIFDKSDGANAMTGLRLSGVPAPSGYMLFSVYARAHKSAFVHVLMLNAPIAFCVDLPGSGYADGSDASLNWSLVVNANGSILYATNGAMGLVAQINSINNGVPAVARTAHIASPG